MLGAAYGSRPVAATVHDERGGPDRREDGVLDRVGPVGERAGPGMPIGAEAPHRLEVRPSQQVG